MHVTSPLPNDKTNAGWPTLENIAALYPQLFSEKRLTEWEELFDEHALVVRTEQGGHTTFLPIHEAMPEQREYASENVLLLEQWDNVEIHHHGNIAVIKADYTLTADDEIRKGVDVLTLVRGNDGWRIVNIAYEQTQLLRR